MTIEVTTPAAARALSLLEVKTFLNLTGNDHDAMLETLIGMATEWAEKTTSRVLLPKTVKQYWDQWPACVTWELGLTPVATVSSVQYLDEDGATQTWSATNYTADTKSTPARIFPTDSADYPALGNYPNAVIVTYTAGYATPADVPDSIKSAMLQKIAFVYEQREDIPIGGVGSGYRVRSADALIFQHQVTLI